MEDSLKKFIPRSNGQKFKNLREATEKETKHENTFGKFPDYVCNSGPFSDSYCFCSAAQHSPSCFLSLPPSLPSPLLPALCLYVSVSILSLSSLYPLRILILLPFVSFSLKSRVLPSLHHQYPTQCSSYLEEITCICCRNLENCVIHSLWLLSRTHSHWYVTLHWPINNLKEWLLPWKKTHHL